MTGIAPSPVGAGGPALGLRTASLPCHGDGQLMLRDVPVSATLAANEAMTARLHRGELVLPLAFGKARLAVHPALHAALAAAAAANRYGPVAGREELRAATAGYWQPVACRLLRTR